MTAVVFVVDDEPTISSTVALILRSRGYGAISFTGPVVALEASTTMPPDILLTDVVMPQMNGTELAIRLSALYPSCKVLLFSGQTSTTDLLADAELKGYKLPILAKPVHPTEVLATLESLFGSDRTAREHGN